MGIGKFDASIKPDTKILVSLGVFISEHLDACVKF